MLKQAFFLLQLFCLAFAEYKIGTASYDMTGPSVEVNFMGYAAFSQTGRGIHQRVFARAYVVDDGAKRLAFVSIDGGMSSDLLVQKVVEKLQNDMGDKTFSYANVCISGTHTHSGPAGFLQYVLFQVTSLGFVKETFNTWVFSIAQAILNANDNLQPGKLYVNQGALYEANINRSPSSYLRNPQSERAKYPEGDTDKNMVLLRFVGADGSELGVLNWFAVHGTSMNNTNRLISGDNRGYASYLLEREMNGPSSKVRPGKGKFVAAFASTNLGDVSPNTNGPKCLDTGEPCDIEHSSCNGRNELCVAFGPGRDMFESTKIIGTKQFEHARDLMKNATTEVKGTLDYQHKFVNMPNLVVNTKEGKKKLCLPAMGYAFAAGTTDGPGMFNFVQGTNTTNPFWNLISGFLSKPTQEQIDCQAPKPILLNTGAIDEPYAWDPHTVPVQVFKIGQVFIAAPPAELTTMSGRRLREALATIFESLEKNPIVTIAGLSNSYSSYVATLEEFQAQRYEAASTLYGPHTLEGYIQEFSYLALNMVNFNTGKSDPPPEDLSDKQFSLLPPVITDRAPIGKSFGEVLQDVTGSHARGSRVEAVFQAGNPRNDQKIGGSFLTVEVQDGSDWNVVAVDNDWETLFTWEPTHSVLSGTSKVYITWDIPADQTAGTYRLCHSGVHKNLLGRKTKYSGCSSSFTVG